MKNKRYFLYVAILVFIVVLIFQWKYEKNISKHSAEQQIALLVSYQKGKYYTENGGGYKECEDAEWDSCVINLQEQFYKLDRILLSFTSPYRHPILFLDSEMKVIKQEFPRDGTFSTALDSDMRYITIGLRKEEAKNVSISGILSDAGLESMNENCRMANCYFGKNVSIIGDSLSAYEGYIREEYYSVYPAADVTVQDMWWYQVARTLGMNICNVNACASSGVTALTWNGLTPDMAGEAGRGTELSQLDRNPDVIWVLLGGNDMIAGVSRQDISESYRKMMNDIVSTYPDAEIFLITYDLAYLQTLDPENWLNTEIKKIAGEYDAKIIDMENSGISLEKPEDCFIDVSPENYNLGIHPNKAGFQLLAEWMTEQMLGESEG